MPAFGAERFVMSCPACDHIDAEGHDLKANSTLVVVLRDVRTGQRLLPDPTTVKTDASGSFHAEFEVSVTEHPAVEGSVFNEDGTNLVLAAHTRVQAPAHCVRAADLPYTGGGSGLLAALSVGLLGVGGWVLFATRSRVRPTDR